MAKHFWADTVEEVIVHLQEIPDFLIPAILMQFIGFSALRIYQIGHLPGPATVEERGERGKAFQRYEAVLEFSQAALGGWIIKSTSSFTGELIGAVTLGLAPGMEEIITAITGSELLAAIPRGVNQLTAAVSSSGALLATVVGNAEVTSKVGLGIITTPPPSSRDVAVWVAKWIVERRS